jgi:iron complex outermembrane receptor protein
MRFWYKAVISTAILAASGTGFAANTNLEMLDNLSFENLGNIITSVSKRPEDSFKSAAAITVITQEDIRLSGATHIAEVLRGVPGLEVARVDSSNWAITSRGFNDVFANKLLVMVDGRTVYTPLFSGVYWDIQDVVLEDIDRIEVIRGPGAALWGANAVNGMINIITKKAEQTQGVYVSQLVGTQDRSITEARYGGTAGNTAYRVYGKFADRMATETLDHQNGNNHWDSGKAGFRADIDASPGRKLTVQGDFYDAGIHLNNYIPTSTAPFTTVEPDKINSRGANVLARLTQKHGDGMESTFQAYYDYQSPSYGVLHQDINTIDFDYQTSWAYNDRNQFVWGAGYRLVSDDFRGTPTLTLNPTSRDTSLYSAFLQDTITLVPKALDLTLGSKFEHNDYSGFEVQPSAKLAWYPTNNQTVWTSVSRSVRTPSRAEEDIRLNIAYDPTNAVMVQQRGIDAMKSEELIAYELGYRWRITPKLITDASVFYNDYNNLRTFEFGAPEVTSGGVVLPAEVKNLGKGNTQGFELATTWDVTSRWSLKGAYTYTELDLKNKPGSTDIVLAQEEGKIPKNQFNIRSNMQLTDNIEWTNTVYYVDKLPLYNVNDYVRLDTRLGWKIDNGIDLALVGQNLLENSHQEFGAPLQGVANKIGREFYAKVTFKY